MPKKEKLPKQMRWAWLYSELEKRANRRYILPLLLVVIAINVGFYQVGKAVGQGTILEGFEETPLAPLDLLMFYSTEQAYAFLEAFGESGRQIYLIAELTLDIVYPVVYSILFTLILIWLLKNSYPQFINNLYKFTFVPFLTAIIDLFENTFIVAILLTYPTQHPWFVALASLFTQIKWMIIPFIFAAILIGIIAHFMNKKELEQNS